MPERARAIVVGAGPGGLTLGLMLARAGVRVTVLEQASGFAREFRGDGLLPSGVQILHDLGLREPLRALERASPIAVRLRVGGILHETPFLAGGSPALTFVPQQQLLEMLASHAGRLPGFALVMSASVKELIVEGGRVAGVRYRAADAAGGRHAPLRDLRAPLVVGFDGRFSTMRRSAGIELEAKRVEFDVAWCSTTRPPGMDRYEATVRGSEVWFWCPSGGSMRVGVLLRKGEYAALRAEGFEGFKRRMLCGMSEEMLAPLGAALQSWEDVVLLPAVSEMARRWWKPGVLLLGDAAHPMSPVFAQGINVALQDAVVAARRLAPVLSAVPERSSGNELDAALAAIETERRASVQRVQRQQNALPRIMRLLGPERAMKLATLVVSPLLRSRFRPKFARAMVDRFLWGDPPVRAIEQ